MALTWHYVAWKKELNIHITTIPPPQGARSLSASQINNLFAANIDLTSFTLSGIVWFMSGFHSI